ncbi:MAG: hypothetical protein IJK44_04735 [Bacteroidales bacterium]|nr:hypothetical protein [Bacteroidales bacterium]
MTITVIVVMVILYELLIMEKRINNIMDKYTRVARVYPAIIGVLPVFILLALCMGEWLPKYREVAGNVKWILWMIGGTSLASLSVGYLASELFRETSKWLFQYPLFKKDETEMPTTKMLLWQNAVISPAYHKLIANKVKATFGIKLPTPEEEQSDISKALKTIVDVVSQIRQYCRGDIILRQYNIEFGFCRNYLGASVWDILVIIGLGFANVLCGWLSWWAIFLALLIQLLLMFCCFLVLETRGWSYAKYLFATFTGTYNK